MRLIDADALRNSLMRRFDEAAELLEMIDEQPTTSTIQEIVTDDGYESGYADGQNEARKDLTFCKDCQNWEYPVQIKGLKGDTSHIGMCELTGWLCGEQGYCMYGREVQEWDRFFREGC